MDLSGTWESWYQYESGGKQYDSTQMLTLNHEGSMVTGQSFPERPSDSAVEIELTMDGRELHGSFKERTDTQGRYKGRTFKGRLHLARSEAGDELRGVWTGASRSGAIKSGPWVLRRATASS